ncbi:flagellar biosynthesis regulator FlaF [Pelagovum pacificum]|uniref:Flagellar biosynthesis regulator FlaF n=1 Tax=Pelagovum pacificum TaxID=2588711 RepID=A0A5C5GK82_9RHOB|nr:flagellar biosynthesis regulator FlaF [Pelagovum pacificum]QQA42988.1 flagellar biosynthesis regulator FlaF [Pelagovum pacificum]TNY33866.1 flagellar biosynthesis regulator FlaF [Pelagovum pacificum]
MNVIERARQGYAPKTSAVRTERATELQLLGQVTSRIRNAAQSQDMPRLSEALFDNRRIWNHLAGEVVDEQNGLPEELRARIFYLAEFVAAHSRKVLRGEATIDTLIEVNTAVMRGLSSGSAR